MCLSVVTTLSAQNECYPPEIIIDEESIGQNSVSLYLYDFNESATWQVAFSTIEVEDPSTLNLIAVSNPDTTFGGLSPETSYYVYVRSLCSDTTASEWNWNVFTTACAVREIPFSENFSFYSSDVVPDCWTLVEGYMGQPSVTNIDGASCLGFRNTSSIALPALSQSVSQLRINFTGRSFQGDCSLEVGVLSDLNDPSAMTVVQTVSLSPTADFQPFEIHFNSYSGEEGYIVLRSVGSVRCYVDDVVVSELPNCMNPLNVQASAVTSTSASLSWTEVGSASQWQYVLTSNASANPSTLPSTSVSATSCSLNNLSPNTLYYFYVRSLCSANEMSSWSSVSFTTDCAVAQLPLEEHFEQPNVLPDCWNAEAVSGTSTPHFSSFGTNPPTSPALGLGMMAWNSASLASGNQGRLVSAPVNTMGIDVLNVNFKWHHDSAPCANDEGVQIQYSFDGTTWNDAPQNLIPRYSELYDGWTEYNVFIPAAASQPVVYVGFLFVSGHGANCFLDEVTLRAANGCLAPSDLLAVNVTGNSADLQWTEMGTAEQWNLVVSETPLADPASGTVISCQSPFYNIASLNPTTTYYAYVQSVCSSTSASDWTRATIFTTGCGTILYLPYEESFDNYGTCSNAFPPCWQRPLTYSYLDGETSQVCATPSATDAAALDGDKSLRFCTPSQSQTYAITPAILEDIHNVAVTFFLYKENAQYSGSIEVGVMSDYNDLASFESMGTFVPENEGEWTFYKVSFENANTSGTGRYIAFRHNSMSDFNYYLLDEVSIEQNADCWHAVNLEVSDVTGNSATFEWLDENETPAAWNLIVSTSPAAPVAPLDLVLDTTFVGTSFTVDFLNGGTHYYYNLCPVCAENSIGQAIAGEFTTLPCNCFVDIEMHDYSSNGWEDAKIQIKRGGTVWQELSLDDGSSRSERVYTCEAENLSFWFVSGVYDADITFTITDADGQTLYTQQQTPVAGSFLNYTPACGIACDQAPTNVTAQTVPGGAHITWTPAPEALYYNLYRDNQLIANYITEHSFFDYAMPAGENCYTVTAVCIVGESEQSASSCVVGINDFDNISLINVYPNPATDKIILESQNVMGKVLIYDALGREVKSVEPQSQSVEIEMPFHNGIYLLKIWDGSRWALRKVVIQK